MKIAIFGDSFAAPGGPHGWPDLLADTHQHNIKNFAQGGSSLFWSYKKLLTHIGKVDVVIFVVTTPGRLYYPDDDLQQHICNSWCVDAGLAGKTDLVNISNRPLYQAAKEYFSHLAQPDFDWYVHDQIVKSIDELCAKQNKRLILIPAFEQNVPYQNIFTFSLYDVTTEELKATFGDTVYKTEKSTRANHMSQENNRRLAKIVNDLLQGNLSTVNIDSFEFKKQPDPELYWEL